MPQFPEEPLDRPSEQGCGFFPARHGLLLNDGRYKIMRKLGRGQYSSTWLVSDSQATETPQYYAAKILTAHATALHRKGLLLELEILKAIKELKGIHKLPRLLDDFEIDGPHGKHLCLVTPVLSTDVSSFRRSAPSKRLGLQAVKIIVVQVVESLVSLHAAQIIHTGRWVNQFRPVSFFNILPRSQWADKEPTTRSIGATGLRAPEVILGANFDNKVDIWAVGCMAFELLTGHWLFNPQSGSTWSIEDDHLAKMMEVTGETFNELMLSASPKGGEYFNKDGKLLRIDQLLPVPLETAMVNYGLPEAEVIPAANFIRACLHLNPEERSSASDLEAHPWLETAYMCC
ncbi:hypothetical protein GALMADRAFT_65792 [Galerina marginata CBS 339.88]|uniref:non-specific serine/threonine protein kinase n=1 Tax=Galerina marginata (strain CBS 339.88) TaxID=685588 RepID=A0A067T590_GALM3|nr:hypothetical protein GALMADRAFT_65792 [Galerina marginata CBS 339.88]